MNLRLSIAPLIIILVVCSSCSYEENRKTATAVEQAVNKFHDELNQAQYQTIYSKADADLQNRVTEDKFVAQLRSAHEQLGGSTSGEAHVFIEDSIWRGLSKALGSKRELVSHGGITGSDLIIGHEKFQWVVESDQPKLVSYEFRTLCRKPCSLSIEMR